MKDNGYVGPVQRWYSNMGKTGKVTIGLKYDVPVELDWKEQSLLDASGKATTREAMEWLREKQEKSKQTWVPMGSLEHTPEDVSSPYGISTGGSGHTSLEPGTYEIGSLANSEGIVRYGDPVPAARNIYAAMGQAGIYAIDNADESIQKVSHDIHTLDAVGRAQWAVSVTDSFYQEYGILPLTLDQVLYTAYSGHDWGLIHMAIKKPSSCMLSDGLEVWGSSTSVLVRNAHNPIDGRVVQMIDMINNALSMQHRPIMIKTAGRSWSVKQYVDWFNTPLPALPELETDV